VYLLFPMMIYSTENNIIVIIIMRDKRH